MRESAASVIVLRGRVSRLLVLGAFALLVVALTAPAAFADASEIVAENALPGSPASEWDVTGAGDPFLQGFAVDMSVDQGQTVRFKVDSSSLADYRLDIYRLGWYGGDGARKVATVQPSVALPQVQPPCLSDAATGLVDCGNWAESASWAVPAGAVSGVYLARLVREDPEDGRASHVVFVVRDDDGGSDLLVQTDDTTWQAYNQYGGNSLYSGSPAGRAYKVSYNRPITTRGGIAEDWVFNSVYPLVRWIERNGYDVSYSTGVDTDRAGSELLEHETFVSVGHDEYWSNTQRLNVEAARAAGVNLAFMSGNEVFWKTRWETSIDGTGTPHRTLVSYKETHAGAKIDPEPNVWTGTWRDKRFSPPADGGRPENALTGTIFTVNGRRDDAIQVPGADGKMRFWRGTSVAALTVGQTATFPNGTLGYEWDEDLDNGHRPAGLVRMSTTTVTGVPLLQDNGSTYASGTATHHLTLYRHASGALVFGAGTVQWSWGLDDQHDFGGAPSDSRLQQATVNLFADMGVQPSTLQAGLTAATASTDTTAPSSTINAPLAGATVGQGSSVVISGTAVDTGGGVVGAVEVSTDNGATWHPANGRETWTYGWQPAALGDHTIRVRAADDSANLEVAGAGVTVTVGAPTPAVCPCTIFSALDTPGADGGDGGSVELGVKFRSDEAGSITGVRFYKHAGNLGTHTGHLWTAGGLLLATAVFTGESPTGWQEAVFPAPIAIAADTTYVVSYHAPQGHYAFSGNYFGAAGTLNAPLRALQSGVDGGNGVYSYGAGGSFPTSTFNAANYWVDAVFATDAGPDTTAPLVNAVAPADGASGVAVGANVVVTFSELVDAATIDGSTVELRDAANALVPAAVTYDAGTRRATLDPTASLADSTQYTLTVRSGAAGVKDVAGNALATDRVSSFTTAAPPPPPPNEGPGGPILVVGTATNPFGRYPAEILRAEGLNEFTVTDISLVNAAYLTGFDVVVLGEMSLSAAQVTMLSNWVDAGGNLIALRPDVQLAGLLGLTPAGGILADAYLKVDTSSSPGAGIVDETIQFHSAADRYALSGATAIATLYSSATLATASPAVTLRNVGSNGGQAAAFTYDLARSIVYTRQGNPDWAGQERDGTAPIRPDDMFFPDWIDLNKVQIPQADEQQRLLANLILEVNRDRKPLPRFWYFPRDEKAVVLMTGDDHAGGGTAGRFAIEQGQSPAGCNVAEWECVRSSSYIYPGTSITDAQAAAFQAQGFEVGTHVNTGCADFTPASLAAGYAAQTAAVAAQLPSIAPAVSERNHCIVFSDWSTQPKTALQNGIRLDTNYYYWPPGWVNDRPGLFTGSGMPMRFADLDGSMIDVYQAATQLTDESGQSYPLHPDVLLDNAVGAKGYYGVLTTNMHTDSAGHPSQQAIVASAQARSVPVVSGRQLLEWLDGRNGSSFQNLSWTGDALSFEIAVGAGANGLRAMVPTQSAVGALGDLTRGGVTVPTVTRTIKGVEYAFFTAAGGSYVASYATDTAAPAITGVAVDPADDGTATVSWTTNEAATSLVEYGLAPGALTLSATVAGLATDHVVPLAGLEPDTTYHYRVVSSDAANNSASSPTASFVTPSVTLVDTTDADFLAGSGNCLAAGGGVRLAASLSEQFSGTALPAGWTPFSWTGSGAVTVAGGAVMADGQRVTSDAVYGPGRVLEVRGTLAAVPFQHFGFAGDEPFNGPPWAIFSSGSAGSTLLARTWAGGAMVDTPIPGIALGQPHDFRIEWSAGSITYSVDGVQVASHAEAISAGMRVGLSDFNADGVSVSVDSVSLTPYSSPCTFTSRVHDAGGAAVWNTLTATADTPASTSIVLTARTGDTATPDATWSEFVPVSGTALGLSGRYLQYRAVLATTDPARTPELREVRLGLSAGADTTAPTILERTPAPGATTVARDANVAVRFSEPLSAASVTPGSVHLRAVGAPADVPAAVSYAADIVTIDPDEQLEPDQVYRVTIDGVTDLAGNALAAADSWTFRTEKLTVTLVDTTDADFGAGSGCLAAGGRVTLAPALSETFDGAALPAGWSSASWTGGGGTVGGGHLSVDGGRAFTNAVFGPGSAVEYVATFGTQPFQHVGFGTGDGPGEPETFNGPTWAMFSNGFSGAGIQARTWGGSQINTDIPGSFIGSPHVFRIDWTPTAIEYRIDGNLVATHPEAIAGPMRVAASDFNNGGGAVTVDSLSMTPYSSPCTFTSRVLDAGGSATWQSLTHTADTPAGTSVVLSVRAGSTPAPDASWTAFAPVPAGGAIDYAARYLQYRAELAAADPAVTPALLDVTATAVVETNEAPVAAGDAYTVAEDGSLDVAAPGVLGNDTDGNGDALAAALVSGPAGGTLTLRPDGSFTYAPAANFNGTDSFTYAAGDGVAASGPATVLITVTPVNDNPTAANDSATTLEDDAVTVNVLANDADVDGDALAVQSATGAAHGALALVAGGVRYTPAANYDGPDSFTYVVSDGHGGTATGSVSVTVTPVNHAPVANPDSVTTNEDVAVTVNVKANDTDADGDTLTVSAPAGAAHGTLSLVTGNVRYTPAANYNGPDSFTYLVSDGNGGTATGTVSVTVTPVNDNPTAVNDTATTNKGVAVVVSVLANDTTAPDTGETLTVTAVGTPANGTATIAEGGTTVRYTPTSTFSGTSAFSYTISDGHGGTATATVTVTVLNVLATPVITLSHSAVTADFGDAIPVVTASATDSDTPLTTLRFTATGLPAGVTISDKRNGTATIQGKPTVSAGTYTATVTVTDGGRTASKQLVVTVTKEAATLVWSDGYWADAGSDFEATATLQAKVSQASDGSNGDVTRSRVEFRLFKSSNLTGTPDLVVGPVQPASDGTAQITRSLDIDTWTVVARLVKDNGYYTGPDAQPVVYTVAIPQYPLSAVAAGYVTDPSYLNQPVAVHASFKRGHLGVAATRAVSFAVMTYAFRGADGLDYVVKGTSSTWSSSLTFLPSRRATLAGSCSVTVLDPATGAVVAAKSGGGYSCRLDLTDTDNIGTYALSVNAPGGALWHRVGTATAQLQVNSSGTLQIRSSS